MMEIAGTNPWRIFFSDPAARSHSMYPNYLPQRGESPYDCFGSPRALPAGSDVPDMTGRVLQSAGAIAPPLVFHREYQYGARRDGPLEDLIDIVDIEIKMHR
jgi:hypothetical protein